MAKPLESTILWKAFSNKLFKDFIFSAIPLFLKVNKSNCKAEHFVNIHRKHNTQEKVSILEFWKWYGLEKKWS
ncbi:MAG: hypothetical protein ACJATA_000443 [Sphingobacteriales bacterium]|jgi:hypothetical protein